MKQYEIEKMGDILKIPSENMDEFIRDFTEWIGIVKAMKQQLGNDFSEEMKLQFQKLVFTPDGKKEMKLYIEEKK